MQKRVRKNSDYICPKKPKLDIPVNIEQEKYETNTMSSQYVHPKEIDLKTESFVRSLSSAECSDFNEINISENAPSVSSNIKTFVKLDPSDSDTVELKEIFKKVLQTEESIDEHIKCPPPSVTSESPNKNLCSGSMNLQQEKSQNPQEFTMSTKNENDSMESLSNFKFSQRENDILIDFETNASKEGAASGHVVVPDTNSICIPTTEYEMYKSDSNSAKDVGSTKRPIEALPLNIKLSEDLNAKKVNTPTSMGNLSIGPVPSVELTTAVNEKKVIPPDQTTAKVSIGNSTISVPLLKNVNFRRIVDNDGKTVSNLVRKVINIHGKKIKAPTIVQVSQVHLNPKTNTKIVQATLVGKKIQLPNIGFKSSSSYKTNFVPAPQCPTMALTSLPKQIFEEESSQSSQPPNQPKEDHEQKSTEHPAINNVNKHLVKTKESSIHKQTNADVQVQKTNPAYLSQFRVIETDSTNQPKSFASITTNASQNTLTVTSSSDGALPKLTTSIAKPSRKPIMLTKTEMMSGGATTLNKDLCEVIRNTNTTSGETNQPKDNQLVTDNTAINKMDDSLPLREQIAFAVQNCNRYQLKLTKTTDDLRAKKSGDFISLTQTKRQITKLNQVMGQSPTTNEPVLLANMEKIEKINTSKSENELLKKLLQSSINQRSTSANNQTIAPRKLATVRAPSLGVVSSLEAQLARPVIPPVSSVGEMKPELKLPSKVANDKFKKNPIDREKINVKSRPEMISRETSFVSTFTPKQRIPPNLTEADRIQTAQANQPNQNSETDASKAMLFQTTQSNNFNSINLFKFFKQKEQSKSGTSETNSNPSQSPIGTTAEDNISDMKLSIKTENDNNTTFDAGCSPNIKTKLVKMDNEQNIELKKRYKRDFQKHKRQMLLNKEPQNHQKKKSRKLSKACEDFDEFIENKVIQMKQMFVLEVLEPLLSTFLGICSVYGYNDKVRNQVEYAYHNVFKEDFGKTNLKNLVDFYSVKPYGPYHGNKVKSVPSFQNKFYDEEFSTMNHESCDKLFQFINTLKLQSLQSSDNISLVSTSPSSETQNHSHSHPNMSYPGIKFPNDFSINTDRMSPTIPFISANNFGVIKRNKPAHFNRNKCSYGNVENKVMLRLSSFVAENILDILRDLDNLLNVHSPVSNKLMNKEKLNMRNIKGVYISRIRNLQKTESTNIQNFLNGTYKCCRNCHLTMICGIVGADSNSNIKKRILADSHYCDKFCCIQYKKKGRKFVISRKRERFYQNNMDVNRISTNDNSFNSSSNYKVVGPNSFWKSSYKGLANEDVNEIYVKMRVAIAFNTNKDVRRCILCNQKGDSVADGSSRLLNYDVNKWVHLNCALWSNSVYETINGGLMNLELTMQQGVHQICSYCNQNGASIKCFKQRCGHVYHLPCALKKHCVFYKNKTINCAVHAHRMEKKNELNSIRVRRRVYIERDENRQVAAVMHHLELSNLLRIGNLTFINVGQLLPHQLEAFHTPNYIYPIGYKIIRFFWSMKKLNKRCRYICSIAETNGRPEFVIQVQEPFENDVELRDISPKAVWQRVLDKIVLLRKGQTVVQLFTEFMSGEDLFGLSEPSIVRILESLPGVESLTDYRFKYGRNPLLELPLALNPSGSARTEPKQRHIINWKKAHTQRTSSINLKLTLSPTSLVAGEVACPYSKQFVHSKSSQYRKMKQEWRNNVYLARSKIQGLGLYAARDLEKHTMVIEYIGQVIRTEVSELREKQYDLRNRGIYMFRLDEERVVDATLSGGLARYINHSCNPNCVTEIVDVDREYRIIIFAKRRISKGEELSYDYKFDIEDDANKISCMCDAPNCRKWMN